MTAKDYLNYVVKEIHTTVVATVDDDGLPVTATIDMMDTDGDSLYFLTAKGKGFYDRLIKRQFMAFTAMKGEDTMSSIAISMRGMVRELGFDKIPELFEKNPRKVAMILEHLSGRLRRLTEDYMSACSLIYGYSQKLNGNQPLSEELSEKIRTFSEKLYD